jgi:hypothetical protein
MSKAVIPDDFHCLPLLKQWGYNPSMFNFQFSMKNEDCLFSPLYSLPACVRERGETALAERGLYWIPAFAGMTSYHYFSLLSNHYLSNEKISILRSFITCYYLSNGEG